MNEHIANETHFAVFEAMKGVLADNKSVDPADLLSLVITGALFGVSQFAVQTAVDPHKLLDSFPETVRDAVQQAIDNQPVQQ